jgi:site-specific recombinase XerD
VLGIDNETARKTVAYTSTANNPCMLADAITRAKILAYSLSSWRSHASAFKSFMTFCTAKGIDLVECTPPSIALYLLELAGNGKSIGVITRHLNSITFVFRWLLIDDLSSNVHVQEVFKFLKKTCPKRCNKKQELGVKEIRKMWDELVKKYGDIMSAPLATIRSFVFLVTQHATFCRYSDLANVKLSDLLYEIDYFTITIRISKTDQAGSGQNVYIPANIYPGRCPQMLMCLYLHRFHADPDPNMYLFPALD